ncbi:MAG: rhomboid family intramembrane serine protease [Rhizomicrobium sp.]|jgi:membrane associated rhomboid family serine protease
MTSQDSSQSEPFLRIPVSVLGLLAVLAIVYAAEALASPHTYNDILGRFAFYPARYSVHFIKTHGYDPGSLIDRAVPFVSYIFLHGSWTHLLINSIWLVPFGSIVARRFGGLLFLVFFLVCGIAGAATHLAFNWGSVVPVVGASAAAAGLMAAGFRIFRYPLSPDTGPLEPVFSARILLWSALWVVINIVAGVTGLGAGPGPQLIAWQAHLGGYAAGLLLAGPFLALRDRMAGNKIEGPTA